MYISLYDDSFVDAMKANTSVDTTKNYTNQLDEYYWNKDYYSRITFKLKLDPMNSWTFPVATGHKYKFHLDNTGSDFETLVVMQSEHWHPDDKPVIFVHNFTDVRHAITVDVGT